MVRRLRLIVIGSGPGKREGAAQAAYFGKRVAVIEKERLREGATQHSRVCRPRRCSRPRLRVGLPQRELYSTVQFSLNRDLTVNDLMCRKEVIVRGEIDRCVRTSTVTASSSAPAPPASRARTPSR